MKKLYRFLLNRLPRPLLIRLSYLFRIVAPILLPGNKVRCTICNRHFGRFLNYGSDRAERDNVLCPQCLSLERHRLIWLYLKDKSRFFETPLSVLHIAPEQCFYKRFRAMKNLDYLCGDLESPLADMHFDLHEIPLPDNRFDVVLCNHVLEHVEDDRRCMTELFRVMKPGGFGIFQVPIDTKRSETYEDPAITEPAAREQAFWQKDHLRLYGLDYPDRLKASGFLVQAHPCHDLADRTGIERYRLQENETLYVCVKPEQ